MVTATIEAVLFAAAKPLSTAELSKHLGISKEVVLEALEQITKERNVETSGIHLVEHNEKVQLVSNPALGEDVSKFLKKEASGPLTRPSLETLTIIAYRGPITKPEIEMIRGVNCSLILRNLLIRGYIDEKEDRERLQSVYALSMDFVRKLGISKVSDLPEYESFVNNEKISELLAQPMEEETQ